MSEIVKNWTEWLVKSRFGNMSDEQKAQTLNWLTTVRDKVLDKAELQPNDVLVDIGTGTGLLAFGAYERLKNSGKVIATDKFQDCIDGCRELAEQIGLDDNFELKISPAEALEFDDNSIDVAVLRSVLVHILEKQPVADEIFRVLKKGGRVSLFEPVISSNTQYYQLVEPSAITQYDKFKEIEQKISGDKTNPLTNFDEKTLEENFKKAGFTEVNVEVDTIKSTYVAKKEMVGPWVDTPPSPGADTVREKLYKYASKEEVDAHIEELKLALDDREITVNTNSVYLVAKK